MGYARYIGHVGALAIALGVGTAIATAPASAETDSGNGDSSQSPTGDGQASPAGAGKTDTGGNDDDAGPQDTDDENNHGDEDTGDEFDGDDESNGDIADATDDLADEAIVDEPNLPDPNISEDDPGDANSHSSEPGTEFVPETSETVAAPPATDASSLTAARIAAPAPATPADSGSPADAPTVAPALLMLSSTTRREDADAPAGTTVFLPTSADVFLAADITPATPDTNRPPTARLSYVTTPGWFTAKVRGDISARDADWDRLTFTTSAPMKGMVTINRYGQFTYTPTSAARHAAASRTATTADKEDIFTVTVSDGNGGTATVDVMVKIRPANSRPNARLGTLGEASPVTGAITGTILATDADGDTVSFSAPASTRKGQISIGANGSFTYTPTAEAREDATNIFARSDSFTVTVRDEFGGSDTVTVRVRISPATAAESEFPGLAFDRPVVDGIGTAYQVLTSINLFSPKTRVIVTTTDGRSHLTRDIDGIAGSDGGGIVAAPEGGAYLITKSLTKTTISVIKADGTVSSATYAGEPVESMWRTPDGTAYTTVATLSAWSAKLTVVTATPDGTFKSHAVDGFADRGAVAGGDGNLYLGYQDGSTAKVLVIDSFGQSTTLQVADSTLVGGVSAGQDGVAYLSTSARDDNGAEITRVYRITASGLSTARVINSSAVGPVAVAPNGTAYQVTSKSYYDQATRRFVDEVFISVITVNGVVTSTAIKGSLRFANSELRLAPNGTAYLPIGRDSESTVGERVLVARPDGTVYTVPTSSWYTSTDDQLVVGPDNKFYIVSYSGDPVVISPDGTMVRLPDSTYEPVAFTPNGTPLLQVFDDAGLRIKNLTTGALSAPIQGGPRELVIGPDGTIVMLALNSDAVTGEVETIEVLATRADGTTVATLSRPGMTGYLTRPGSDGISYVTILGTTSTQVYRLATGGATLVAEYERAIATGAAALGPDGTVYISTLNSSAKVQMHVIPPTSTL